MVDIHTHILPGIDDGAIDLYDTLDMAQMAAMASKPKSGAPSMGAPLDEAKIVQNMPENIQSRFDRLPEVAQDALLRVQGH